jgi:peptidoglycan/xylan/chitin deacetylase (PgdA/CDA1 family)
MTTAQPVAADTFSGKPADPGWGALLRELDAWRSAGRTASLWWRDDDATTDTPALRRLLDIVARHAVPLGLAVIPAKAGPALFAALEGRANIEVLQHGYAHANHARADAKKCELGSDRPAAVVIDELRRARDRLAELSGGRALPVMVPPWNRIDPAVAAALPSLGVRGLSVANPRGARRDAAGLVRANAHVDVIDWTGGRDFVGTASALAAASGHLRARRAGTVDPDEPTCMLTHHLAHDEATWQFVDAFIGTTMAHPAARWLPASLVFDVGR